ncbi:hypothetical protein BHE74_00057024 [Ensete ventricosum]|nr:hypothetical protein GW17_00031400 [Ensete ventricosum]RWW37826.1 hypothetical protein BHE74_00057024 [Ensete ventricosum]
MARATYRGRPHKRCHLYARQHRKGATSVSSTRAGLNRIGTEENSREFSQEHRKTIESSVLCSAGLGSPALMPRRLPRQVYRGRDYR